MHEFQFMGTSKTNLKAPFRGTLHGFVNNTQEGGESLRGNMKKYFELVDAAGHWLPCCAMGNHARNEGISDGAEVLVFFATGRGQVKESPAVLYLFQEAVIVKVRAQGSVPNKRFKLEVTLKSVPQLFSIPVFLRWR